MRHHHHGFGAMLDGVFDCWHGADDALSICYVAFFVLGDVEIDLSETPLS